MRDSKDKYMRNQILFAIFLLSCIYNSGCNSAITKNSIKPKYSDSFINAEQNKLIGELRFGMNKNEAEKEIVKFHKNNERGNKYFIGNFEYQSFGGWYDDSDRLYGIEISSPMKFPDDNFMIRFQVDEITSLIHKKYGDADYDTFGYFKIDSLLNKVPNSYDIILKEWTIGKKKIEMHLWQAGLQGIRIIIKLPELPNLNNEKKIQENDN